MKPKRSFTRRIGALATALVLTTTPSHSQVHPSNLRASSRWIEIRDSRIIKQSLDYSCGAASLATILNEFYGLSITEADVFNRLENQDAFSFADLVKVSHDFGFKAGGLQVDFEKLLDLQVPVITYLNYRGQDHFTVITGVSKDGIVSVADPSWGNRRFRRSQFEEMWLTVGGRILLVIPKDLENQSIDTSFFSKSESFENLVKTLTALEVNPFR